MYISDCKYFFTAADPVSVIAYRSQYGSVNPTAVVGPGIVATAVSTGAAILFCRIMDRKS